ncbi:MAG: hypothetical protein JWM19_1595 [Actinomycetia bacterium]|nr:hypothetical protein [Actinomycetes bacterium]
MHACGGYISQWDLLLGTAAMDYCTRCGDRRTTGAAACPRCGTRFGEPPGDATQADVPYPDPSPTIWDYGLPGGPGAPPARGTGPALGYFDEPQKLPADTSDPFWRVFAGAAQQPPPGSAAQGGPRQGGPRPRPASHRRPPRRPPGTLLAGAILLVIALGGGTYAAVKALTGHSGTATAQQASHPAVTSGASASPAAQASSLPTTRSPSASPASRIPTVPANPPSWALPGAAPATAAPPSAVSGSVRPTTPAPPTATSISVTPTAASSPVEPRVVAFLVRYFSAINDHDYQAFVSLLNAREAAAWTPASFAARFGTTADSDATLTSIAGGSSGGAAASVTFTSHQAPSESPDGSSCDVWSITLYLIPANSLAPADSGYVIGQPPPGYSAQVRACLAAGRGPAATVTTIIGC